MGLNEADCLFAEVTTLNLYFRSELLNRWPESITNAASQIKQGNLLDSVVFQSLSQLVEFTC
jgi:hypothetical protein